MHHIVIISALTLALIGMMGLLFYNWFYMYEMKKIEEEMTVRLPGNLERALIFNTAFSLLGTIFFAALVIVMSL